MGGRETESMKERGRRERERLGDRDKGKCVGREKEVSGAGESDRD